MSNDDRLAQWRKQQGIAPLGDAEASTENLDSDAARKDAAARTLLPTSEEIEQERAATIARRDSKRAEDRRKMLIYIAIPALLFALYHALIARPLYEAESTFTITTVGGTKTGGGVGLLAGVTGGAGLNDDYRVREYLLSREAMLEMQRRHGFLDHYRGGFDFFGAPRRVALLGIDPHDFYLRRVKITVDMQEQLVHLKVRALTPEDAAEFANELLELGTEKVQSMSERLNTDQINALEEQFAEAESNVREATARVAAIQRNRADVDPTASAANVYSIIANFEVQLAEVENERQALLANGLTESPLLPRLNARANALEEQIERQRQRLVGQGSRSVQRNLIDIETANAQKRLAESNLESVLRTLEQARLRALEQRRYLLVLSRPVPPSISEIARIPRFFLTVAIIALIAMGIGLIARRLRTLRTS